ncbi:MAG: GNAT family N-acetyltransferase [Candidatus Hodarchaeota archaeon]
MVSRMILEYPVEKHEDLIPFFDEHSHLSAPILAFLKEGGGEVFVDNLENPEVALLSYKVLYILAGQSSNKAAKELLSHIPRHRLIIVPNEEWERLLRKFWGIRLVSFRRTKFSSQTLDLDHIKKLKGNLAEEYIIERINAQNIAGFDETMANDFFGVFGGPKSFLEKGFGFCVRDGEKVISAAATGFTPYKNAFEMQVETINSPDYRHKGLATAVCANLIEYSLENGFDPRWDAENERSKKFALKLGYSDPVSYNVYMHTKLLLKTLKKTKLLRILRLFYKQH